MIKSDFERPEILEFPLSSHTLAGEFLKSIFMRKLIFLCVALMLPLFAFEMSADEKEVIVKIPIKTGRYPKFQRDLTPVPVDSYYNGLLSSINTIVTSDLGDVDIIVTNLSTGESWSDSFDASMTPQFSIQISGTSGYYVIEYITEDGGLYEGEFLIE